MPQSQPAATPLAAAEPFGVRPERETTARQALTALSRVRFASEAALLAFAAPLGFQLPDLETWCAIGLVRRSAVLDGIGNEPVPYLTLGPRGARELAASGVGHVSAPAKARASYKRLHDVQLGDFGLAVLALSRDRHIRLMGVQFDDRRLTTSAPVPGKGACITRIPLQADAYVLTETERGPVGLLLELDRATTSPKKLKDKYAGYLAWMRSQGPERDFGLKALRVVTIVPNGRRLEALHEAALQANGLRRSGFLLFVERCHVDVRDPGKLLQPIARPLGNRSDSHLPLFESYSGLRDPQAVAPAGGTPPGCAKATRSMPGDPGTSSRSPAVTARSVVLTLWSAPGRSLLARGLREALPVAPGGDAGLREGGARAPVQSYADQ